MRWGDGGDPVSEWLRAKYREKRFEEAQLRMEQEDPTKANGATNGATTTTNGVEPARIVPVRLSLDDIRNPPCEQFVLGRTVPLGKSTVLFGPTSVGKSALAAQIAFAFAAGAESLWGLPLLPGGGAVLIYTAEDSVDDWKRKVAAIFHAANATDVATTIERVLERIHVIDRSEGIARLSEVVTVRSGTTSRRLARATEERDRIIAVAKQIGAKLIEVETASRLVDDEDNANFSALQSALGHIGRETSAGVLTTHHATKAATKDNDSSIEGARGGSAFVYNARNALALFPAEPDEAKPYADRFPAEDVFILSHGKPTSSTRRQAPILLVRCGTPYGAVFRRPDDVQLTPEQEVAHAARLELARQREGEQLRRLYRVVEKLLMLGPVSPSRLREHVTEIGVLKRELDGLVSRAVALGYLNALQAVGGRGVRLGLGRDPRKEATP